MSALEPALHVKAILPRLTAIAMRVAGKVRGFARMWVNRRHMAELAELSDYQLADIGLTREDLKVARSLPLGRDPTVCLADVARRRAFDNDFVRLNS
ncbi:MAG: DUF1127 domain-containing protein [Aliihoeflea sp.]